MDRRSMLTLTGTALAAALSGCSAFGSGDGAETLTGAGTDPSAGTPTDSPTPTTSPTDVHTPTPTDVHTPTPTDDHTPTETATPTESGPDVPSALVNGSFEDDWAAWTVGRHLPEDPNREGDREVASAAGVTTETATDGTTACRLFIDGSQDDGTVWVQQPVDLTDYAYLAVDYEVSTSFNQIRNAAVYAGPRPDDPLTETDFDTEQSLEGHDAEGWKTLTYDVDHDGPGLVAVGFSVVWETEIAARLDNVRLSADEPSTITPSPSTETDDEGSI
jgi:hypothetical protein